MTKISYFSLGGQDEKGKYSGILEINNDLFILNAGIGSDLTNQFGIRKVIPNLSFIKENKDRFKGIFIGTPKHLHIGSLFFFLEILKDVPIYTSEIGKTIIESMLAAQTQNAEFAKKKIKPNIQVVRPINDFVVGNTRVCAIKVCNSLPDSYGWIFKILSGSVVFLDEFVAVNDRIPGYESHLQVIAQQTKNKVALLIVGVQNIGKNLGYASPGFKAFSFLKKTISNTNGRVFVSCYDNDLMTVKNLAEIACLYGLKFCIYSNSLNKLFDQMVKLNYVSTKNLTRVKIDEAIKDHNSLILITGNQDRLYHKLHKILTGEDANISFLPSDAFILSTITRSGLELQEAKLLDGVSRLDVKTFKLPKTVHLMEAGDEDHKLVANILRPRYIIPVNGYYKEFINYAKAASQVVNVNSFQILYNGEIFNLENGKIKPIRKITSVGDQYVDSIGVIDIGTSILLERQSMNASGVVLISTVYNKESHSFLKPEIQLIGVLADDHKKKDEIFKSINRIAETEFIKTLSLDAEKKNIDLKTLKMQLKKLVARLFERQLQKKPLTLIVVGQHNKLSKQ